MALVLPLEVWMKRRSFLFSVFLLLMVINANHLRQNGNQANAQGEDGQFIFRFDTFGDEQLWTDFLQLHKPVEDLSPRTALSVGLQVDSEALPQEIIDAIEAGEVDLDDPAVTIQLLKLNAVVGVIGKFAGASDQLQSVGTTCALCHSVVDNSVAPGIGKRLDGWPNRNLNVGAIIALSPKLTVKAPFNSWGPGKYDPHFQAFNGDEFIPRHSPSFPVVIPPAFGLDGVDFETFTAEGSISYWNNYVGVTQMGGHGNFTDQRIGLNITQSPDMITSKLPALLQYQLSLPTPPPPPGSFDRNSAKQGEKIFNGVAQCATCHPAPLYTDVLTGPDPTIPFLHNPLDVGQEPMYASRSANLEKGYRATPLRALWQHPPYFHDGSASTLEAVVDHYNSQFFLGLSEKQKDDLVEFLKTL